MTAELTIRVAHSHVKQYEDLARHWRIDPHDALECVDCQDWLQKGVESFRWIRKAEECLLEAERLGVQSLSDANHQALDFLYESWLKTSDRTEPWIVDLQRRQYAPENLNDFRHTCSQVRAILVARKERPSWQSGIDISSSDFEVTARDARFAQRLFDAGRARLTRDINDHRVREE